MNLIEPSKTIITCNVSTSISSLLSAVTGVVKESICKLFPDEYFQEIFIGTSQANAQQVEMEQQDDDVMVKRYPQLSIIPQFNVDIDDMFGGPYPMWRRGVYQRFRTQGHKDYGYKKIFYNDADELIINAIPSRVKFTFDCKIKLETHLLKIDTVHYLRQRMNTNDIFYLNDILLESDIPNTIIDAIAKIKNFNLEDQEELDNFYKYLKQYSQGTITEKIEHSSGLKVFSFLYAANILTKIENPPEADTSIERVNMSEGDGLINFTISMELWSPSNYLFECSYLPKGNYNEHLDMGKVTVQHVFKARPPREKDGRVMFKWNKFVTDVNVKVDKIDLDALFTQPMIDLIKDRSENKDEEFLNDLFEIVVYEDEKELIKDKDFRINWSNLSLEMIYPKFNYVYNVGIYGDNAQLAEVLKLR
jgi:hypothetical protein